MCLRPNFFLQVWKISLLKRVLDSALNDLSISLYVCWTKKVQQPQKGKLALGPYSVNRMNGFQTQESRHVPWLWFALFPASADLRVKSKDVTLLSSTIKLLRIIIQVKVVGSSNLELVIGVADLHINQEVGF